jgi:cytidine deaminase
VSAQADELAGAIAAAREASGRAYCPSSKFRVGAAVVADDGEIVAGCNVENASFGLTICAERNAIFQAVARGKTRFRLLVVYTPTPTPTAPCGACRQVLNEFGPAAAVDCVCHAAGRLEGRLDQLLPHAFGPRNLG